MDVQVGRMYSISKVKWSQIKYIPKSLQIMSTIIVQFHLPFVDEYKS